MTATMTAAQSVPRTLPALVAHTARRFGTRAAIADGDVRPAPVLIDIVFGANGETVRQETFRATLNNVDVTHKFVVTGPNSRRGVFAVGLGSVSLGRNVLLTTVEGIVPGTTRTASDTDRISFTVQ